MVLKRSFNETFRQFVKKKEREKQDDDDINDINVLMNIYIKIHIISIPNSANYELVKRNIFYYKNIILYHVKVIYDFNYIYGKICRLENLL